jgi:hypothetical protein
VLWIYASSETRFEQSVREIVALVKITGWDDPNADVFQLLRSWLFDARNRLWLIVLDNADDVDFLVSRSESGRLFDCIPVCDHGVVIITSRSKIAARQLVEGRDIIDVSRMDEASAIALVALKLGEDVDTAGSRELVAALEFMPLAITQATACLQQSWRKSTIDRYL